MGVRSFAWQVRIPGSVGFIDRYATPRNRRPCQNRGFAPRLTNQQCTQQECPASTTVLLVSKATLGLPVAEARPLCKRLSSAPRIQHPVSQISSPLPIVSCQHRFELKGAHTLAAVCYCMRVSRLLMMMLRLATDGTGCALFVSRRFTFISDVCPATGTAVGTCCCG